MGLGALLRGLGAVVLGLAAPACGGGEEWVCDGVFESTEAQICRIAWSCEGPERFESVNVRIDCQQDGDRFLCKCIEMDPNSGEELTSDETFEADSGICNLSAETADLANGGCGWAVPEEDL